jgi:serine/threonine-protein kinase
LGSAVPADLEALIMRCLEKEVTDRPQSAAELKRGLDACRDVGEWDASRAQAWWAKHPGLIGDGRSAAEATDVDAPTQVDSREPPASETAPTVRVEMSGRR